MNASDLKPISYGFDRTKTHLHDRNFLSLFSFESSAAQRCRRSRNRKISAHKICRKVSLQVCMQNIAPKRLENRPCEPLAPDEFAELAECVSRMEQNRALRKAKASRWHRMFMAAQMTAIAKSTKSTRGLARIAEFVRRTIWSRVELTSTGLSC